MIRRARLRLCHETAPVGIEQACGCKSEEVSRLERMAVRRANLNNHQELPELRHRRMPKALTTIMQSGSMRAGGRDCPSSMKDSTGSPSAMPACTAPLRVKCLSLPFITSALPTTAQFSRTDRPIVSPTLFRVRGSVSRVESAFLIADQRDLGMDSLWA